MRKTILNKATIASAAVLMLLAACDKKKIEDPKPVEQELITTIQLNITGSGGFDKTFSYRVENGFGSTTQGNISIDSLVLAPNQTYSVAVKVLNEKASPAEDITEEVIEEKDAHLFLFQSTPVTGNGSISITDGSKDSKSLPFNQSAVFHTGDAGSGKLVVTLKHEPADKTAQQPEGAGGETDAEATFPVTIK
jgi:hypothetical protein